MAELLIEKGALVDALDSNEQTPLHLASRYEQGEIIKLLLKAGRLKIVFLHHHHLYSAPKRHLVKEKP